MQTGRTKKRVPYAKKMRKSSTSTLSLILCTTCGILRKCINRMPVRLNYFAWTAFMFFMYGLLFPRDVRARGEVRRLAEGSLGISARSVYLYHKKGSPEKGTSFFVGRSRTTSTDRQGENRQGCISSFFQKGKAKLSTGRFLTKTFYTLSGSCRAVF